MPHSICVLGRERERERKTEKEGGRWPAPVNTAVSRFKERREHGENFAKLYSGGKMEEV